MNDPKHIDASEPKEVTRDAASSEESTRAAASAEVGGAVPKTDSAAPGSAAPAAAERVGRMGTASIPKLTVEFAIPAILGMVVNGAYNLIDSVFLGHGAGELALSAVTVATPIMTFFMAISMLIGAGGNALCALRLGEGKHDEAENILGNTFSLGVIVAVLLAVLAHVPAFIEPLLSLSSSTEAARPLARTFIQIISLGAVFQIVGLGINNFIRTTGAPNRALVTMLVGAVGCTVFNAVFVLGFGWGVAGSALATISGQAISCISVLWYFTRTPNVPLRLRLHHMPLKARLVTSILALGTASFIVQIGAAVSQVVTNYALAKYGALDPIGADNALAAIGVVGRVAMFTILPLIGMSIAIQPLLGFNYGARLWSRVKETLRVGVLGATIVGTVLWVLIMAFAPQIVLFFGISDAALVDLAAFAMRVNLIFLPVIGFQIVGSNYFQATGQPTKSSILSLLRQIVFLIPLTLILPEVLPGIVPQIDSLDAVYFAVPAADFLAIFTVGVYVAVELRRLNRRIAEEGAARSHAAA